MVSAAQHRQRKEAGRHSHDSRRSAGPINPDILPPVSTVDVDASMEAYVAMVGAPTNWPDVKTYEQVKTEIFKNQDAARELAVKAHRLFTSEQVRARDERWNAIAHDRLDLVERLLDGLDAVPQDLRKAFLTAARSWRLETMKLLSGANVAAAPIVAPSASVSRPADSTNEQGNT